MHCKLVIDGNAAAVPTGPTHPDQEPTTLPPLSPLQVAHHSLSEAGSRGAEGAEPEGLGADERSITSTSSRGARPQHPGHRRALVTLWNALHRTPMLHNKAAVCGLLLSNSSGRGSSPATAPWPQGSANLSEDLCSCGGPAHSHEPPGCLSRQKRPSHR